MSVRAQVRTADLVARDRAVLWHPYTQMKISPEPLPVVWGEGVFLFTGDGRKLLDGISSWWVNVHGHSHPALNEALACQASLLEHVVFAGCTHPKAVELAERLVEILPGGLRRVFYSDNGSTAVEVALKMACQYWQQVGRRDRRTFIALDQAYHGDTVGAMSASAASVFTRPFGRMMFEIKRVANPYCYRCPVGLKRAECNVDCLGGLEAALVSYGDEIAGVIVEPMLQGAGGMISWPAEFLAGVRRLCDRFGTLMIADEVLTGFGRTGKMFACEHADVSPDIMCLSKGLTAGYMPLAATVATDAIYEAFLSDDRGQAFFHGHSYTANPLACAVAVASLDLFEEEETLYRVECLEDQMKPRFEGLRELECVGDVRVIGGVGAIELVEDAGKSRSGSYLDDRGAALAEEFIRRGLLLRPLGNVIYFMPPFVIKKEETEWAVDQIEEVIGDLCVGSG